MERQPDKSDRHQRIEQLTRELRQTNAEVDRILDRIPLSNHEQVTRLANLVEKGLDVKLVTLILDRHKPRRQSCKLFEPARVFAFGNALL